MQNTTKNIIHFFFKLFEIIQNTYLQAMRRRVSTKVAPNFKLIFSKFFTNSRLMQNTTKKHNFFLKLFEIFKKTYLQAKIRWVITKVAPNLKLIFQKFFTNSRLMQNTTKYESFVFETIQESIKDSFPKKETLGRD